MKSIAAVACLLFATSLMQAQTPVAPASVDTKDTKTPTTKDVAPAPGKTAPGKTDDKKKDDKKKEELPKIPGVTITRPDGNLLGLEVVGGVFKLTFYNKKHKPMNVDVTRANARWPNKKSATVGDNRTVLNGSGTALIGQKPVVPPLVFNVYLTLLQGEGDDAKAVESYVVPFHD